MIFFGVITLLSNINSPEDIKDFSQKELTELAQEIRKTIIETVGQNGGHLASNLGVVELTIALHKVFNSPQDAIIWDVSHQCYAHKILTGRYKNFSTLRTYGGLSGFTKKHESPHDFFDAGHSSTSISSALGLLTAWQLQGRTDKVIAIIGDGALTGGMAMEAIAHAGQLAKNLIIIVNDNQMSIDPNTGSISRYLSRISMSKSYQNIKTGFEKILDKVPFINKFLIKFFRRFKRSVKGMFLTTNLFSDLGCEYIGPLDGHDFKQLIHVLNKVKKMNQPVVVHVMTQKGRGYSPAEDHPEKFHGIGPFCISDGTVEKFDTLSFTEAFSNSLMNLAKNNNKIACITAAMAKGTGLDSFARHYPDRFFDVGIAEEHAVTFGGGLSVGGILPVICIYSTFMQRAVDQVIHDIALQDIPAVIMLDRAGPVPADGETHQGLFDIALFRPVPNISIMSPASAKDLDMCFNYAVESKKTVIIRYPKMSCPTEQAVFSSPIEIGRGCIVKAEDIASSLTVLLEDEPETKKVLFVCTGGMYSDCVTSVRALAMKNILADIYTLRFIKPFDFDYFYSFANDYDCIVLVEDGVKDGGIAEQLQSMILERGYRNVSVKAFPSKFYAHGTRAEVCLQADMTSEDLTLCAMQLLNKE